MDETAKKYNTLAQKMTNILGLKGSPVAIAMKNDVPSSIPIGAAARHCEMVQRARLDGAEFYATVNEQACKGGAAVMGLMDMPENVACLLYTSPSPRD